MRDVRNIYLPAVAGVLAATFVVAAPFVSAARAQLPPMPVVLQTAKLAQMVKTTDAIGYVHAFKEAPIKAVIADRVLEIRVSEGARVTKGDILVKLDDTVEQAQLKSAKLTHKIKKDALTRLQTLVRRQVAARTKVAEAQEEVVLALVEVEQAEISLSHTLVRAPFDGIIGAFAVEEGDYTAALETLTTIYAIDPMQVRFQIPQRKIGELAVGQAVKVWSSAGRTHQHTGTVTYISPALDSATRSVAVRAVLDPTRDLRPGSFVSLSVAVQTIDQAIAVPDAALMASVKGFSLYVVKDGKAKLTPVKVGLRTGKNVQITEGLAAGDQFVLEGQLKLRDGAAVVAAPPASGTKTGSAK